MQLENYLLSFEAWLKKMEEKHNKLTAFLIGVWVFVTIGYFIKSIEIYLDIGHKVVDIIR